MQGDRPNPTRHPADLTQLIEQAGSGSTQARTDLLEAVAGELRTIAASLLRRESDAHTLNATALVNESYLRLFRTGGLTPELSFEHRHAFFLAASTAMRRILIDHARAKATAKRAIPNAVRGRIDVDLVHASTEADPHDLLALDDALTALEAEDERAASVVRLRFYAGRQIDEIAELLGVASRTVKRDWEFARARLQQLIEAES